MGIKYLVFLNVWCLVCSPELCQGLERREWEKARLVVFTVFISAVGQELRFLVGRKFEILLAAVNLTLKVIGTHGALTVYLSHQCL